MKNKELGLAVGLATAMAGTTHANDSQNTGEWDQYYAEKMQLLAQAEQNPDSKLAQQVTETGQITKNQVAQIQSEVAKNSRFSFDVKGAENYIQTNVSFMHNNLGLGIQASHSDNVDQVALTGGIELTPSESSALSKVIENGQIKVSLVESEVKNALADFDESGQGIEFVLNLRNAFLKQVSISHSQHELDITDGSNEWKIDESQWVFYQLLTLHCKWLFSLTRNYRNI